MKASRSRRLAISLAISIAAVAQSAAAQPSIRSIHRAEISSDEQISLCVSGQPDPRSSDTHFTLHLDARGRRGSTVEAGCGPRGGRRLAIGPDRIDGVYLSRGAIVYVSRSGREQVIEVGPTIAERTAAPGPSSRRGHVAYETSDPYATAMRSRRASRYPRLSEREGSSIVVVPGPRASEIGDVAAGAVLGGLEETLDPVVEPALVFGLRATFAGAGAILGAALYVPTTLLDVLCSEL